MAAQLHDFSRNKRKKQPGLRNRQTGLEIDEMQGL